MSEFDLMRLIDDEQRRRKSREVHLTNEDVLVGLARCVAIKAMMSPAPHLAIDRVLDEIEKVAMKMLELETPITGLRQ